jgi:hypothetical protein
MRLRLHVSVEGKSPSALFEGYLRSCSRTSTATATRVDERRGRAGSEGPDAGVLVPAVGVLLPTGVNAVAKLEEMDADEDGRATAEEFISYYRRSGLAARASRWASAAVCNPMRWPRRCTGRSTPTATADCRRPR